MISDTSLYSLSIFLGSLAMLLIVLYHFLQVNAPHHDDRHDDDGNEVDDADTNPKLRDDKAAVSGLGAARQSQPQPQRYASIEAYVRAQQQQRNPRHQRYGGTRKNKENQGQNNKTQQQQTRQTRQKERKDRVLVMQPLRGWSGMNHRDGGTNGRTGRFGRAGM